jgi:hypothetical protein
METIGTIFCITLAAIVFAALWVIILIAIGTATKYIWLYVCCKEYKDNKLPLWQKVTLKDDHYVEPMMSLYCGRVLVRHRTKGGGYSKPQVGEFDHIASTWNLLNNGEVVATYHAGDDIEVIWVDKFTTKKK